MAPKGKPQFVTGSLLRHVCVMASTGAIGLIAVFAVDLINLFYLSLLGHQAIAAAIGFAGVVGFFHASLAIGLTIGTSAVVSRLIGAGRDAESRRMGTTALLLMTGLCVILGTGTVLFLAPILKALGATGETRDLAHRYLSFTVHSLPLMGLGMACSALLRSVGDARRSMMVTLGAAIVTAVLDPILIFGFKLGLDGAAISAIVSRLTMTVVGLYGVTRTHHMLGKVRFKGFLADSRRLSAVAAPAVLTNLATPVGAAFVTQSIAQFGPSAVAGQATIDRLSPVAFGLVYALSGAVGPILAQNLGAQQYDRVRQGLRNSLWFMIAAVGFAWLVLATCQDLVIRAFSATGVAAEMIVAFCSWLSVTYLFVGALFVANAAFNNLGRPLWSTGFNWARATLGTIPLAWWGSQYGPIGVLAGQALGAAIFGSLAMWFAYRLSGRLGASLPTQRPGHPDEPLVATEVPDVPAASGPSALAPLAATPDA